MGINEVAPERLAELFHHYHEALTVENPEKRINDHAGWMGLPANEKSRLVAAARLALLELESTQRGRGRREYFAQPGEAEWGC
jgi:hypothetical protein